jgi:hypothetical protein
MASSSQIIYVFLFVPTDLPLLCALKPSIQIFCEASYMTLFALLTALCVTDKYQQFIRMLFFEFAIF